MSTRRIDFHPIRITRHPPRTAGDRMSRLAHAIPPLMLTGQESQDRDLRQAGAWIFLRVVREPRGGRMQVVRVDTLRIPTR